MLVPSLSRPATPRASQAAGPYWLDGAELFRRLETDGDKGLEPEEAAARLARFGPNELEMAEPIHVLGMLLRQFTDLMVLILLAAAGIALLSWWVGGARGFPADTVVIGAIVILNAVLGFVQEYRAEKTVHELKRTASVRARVIRGGHQAMVDRVLLVPGDVIVMGEGDRVPADAILLGAERLQVDESLLTGESRLVSKHAGRSPEGTPVDSRPGQVFAGTTVAAGTGRAVVIATGSNTELGGIATSVASTRAEGTPLGRRLARLGSQIGWGVLILSSMMGGTILLVEQRMDPTALVRILMFSVALAVAAVPEGLPAVLTVSLSSGTRRLARKNAVVRRLAAAETLGSVTVIVTDKTGTLTHNEMTISALFYDGRHRSVSGQGYEAAGSIHGDPKVEGTLEPLLAAGVLAGTGSLDRLGPRRQAVGDPVDAALLVLAEKAGVDWQLWREQSHRIADGPFSSERARASSLRVRNGARILFVKGSLEVISSRADSVLLGGRTVRLDNQQLDALREAESRYAGQGLRTLALAFRPEAPEAAEVETLEERLTLLGLVGMGDPPRAEAAPALEKCRRAGIRVLMLTGDHPRTALSVARQIGLSHSAGALTGPEVERLTDQDLARAVVSHNVFARMSPQAKLRLVTALVDAGEVVAMTGDGVNDAPALKKVHVGVAMGSGTAVAVEASDLVLLDDNFTTIVTAVAGGRQVFTNVQKFIAFLFSGNLGVVLAMFAGALLAGLLDMSEGGQVLLPLTAAQILWMNLVTDGAPAVAFSLGRSRPETMDRPPRAPDDPILSANLWRYVVLTGVTVAGMFLLVLDAYYERGLVTCTCDSSAYARTAGFYLLVTARLWNSLNFRHLPGTIFSGDFFRDFAVPAACLLSWTLTLAVLLAPPMGELFGLVPLRSETLLLLTGAAAFVVLPAELYKRFARAQYHLQPPRSPRAPR
ncbi:MAG: cation-transporting P-type ATPase [Armatimonadetes bacterium]|nr:cation-transporting P-type ATPase [Armatimonadota bacterium]